MVDYTSASTPPSGFPVTGRKQKITSVKAISAGVVAEVVPADAGRTYLKVFNDTATTKRFAVGSSASASVGIPVPTNTGYEWPEAPIERVTVFCSAAENYQVESD